MKGATPRGLAFAENPMFSATGRGAEHLVGATPQESVTRNVAERTELKVNRIFALFIKNLLQ